MKNIVINPADQMTPYERKQAAQNGKETDRVLCVPFMSELKCRVSGISVWDFWHDAKKWLRQKYWSLTDLVMIG